MRDPAGEFAEIYGSALVAQRRMFLLCVLMALLTIGAIVALAQVASSKVAIPWFVQVNDSRGVISQPVRIQNITPGDAVLKAELAKWVEWVYSIDVRQTPAFLRNANGRVRGMAVEQFSQYRAQEDIYTKLREQPDLIRLVKVTSVDLSQKGIAFVFMQTTEGRGATAPTNPRTFRITINYALIPPATEEEIFANPLGLFVTFFNTIEERSR